MLVGEGTSERIRSSHRTVAIRNVEGRGNRVEATPKYEYGLDAYNSRT